MSTQKCKELMLTEYKTLLGSKTLNFVDINGYFVFRNQCPKVKSVNIKLQFELQPQCPQLKSVEIELQFEFQRKCF